MIDKILFSLMILLILLALGSLIFKIRSILRKNTINKGETQMVDILKEKVNDAMDNLNKEWVNQVKKAEKEGGLDMSEMFGKYSQIIKDIDKEFNEFKNRKQKKGWM